jgi:hypothetical protein
MLDHPCQANGVDGIVAVIGIEHQAHVGADGPAGLFYQRRIFLDVAASPTAQ